MPTASRAGLSGGYCASFWPFCGAAVLVLPGPVSPEDREYGAPAKPVRIFHGQHISQRDPCSHTLDLLQLSKLGTGLLGDWFDPPVILRDPLVQRCDFRQQRFQSRLQLRAPSGGRILALLL